MTTKTPPSGNGSTLEPSPSPQSSFTLDPNVGTDVVGNHLSEKNNSLCARDLLKFNKSMETQQHSSVRKVIVETVHGNSGKVLNDGEHQQLQHPRQNQDRKSSASTVGDSSMANDPPSSLEQDNGMAPQPPPHPPGGPPRMTTKTPPSGNGSILEWPSWISKKRNTEKCQKIRPKSEILAIINGKYGKETDLRMQHIYIDSCRRWSSEVCFELVLSV